MRPIREEINRLIKEFFEKNALITAGRIYFTLDSKVLQDRAYQYILFGHESLLPLADKLETNLGFNFRKRMSEKGQSTIVKALLPNRHDH